MRETDGKTAAIRTNIWVLHSQMHLVEVILNPDLRVENQMQSKEPHGVQESTVKCPSGTETAPAETLQ